MYGQERGKLICRICQAQRKSASSAKDAFCNANGVFARMGGFFAILRTRFACAQPAIFNSADRSPQSAQIFGKTSISFAGAGAKTCGLNALAHNLCLKKTKVYRIKKKRAKHVPFAKNLRASCGNFYGADCF